MRLECQLWADVQRLCKQWQEFQPLRAMGSYGSLQERERNTLISTGKRELCGEEIGEQMQRKLHRGNDISVRSWRLSRSYLERTKGHSNWKECHWQRNLRNKDEKSVTNLSWLENRKCKYTNTHTHTVTEEARSEKGSRILQTRSCRLCRLRKRVWTAF